MNFRFRGRRKGKLKQQFGKVVETQLTQFLQNAVDVAGLGGFFGGGNMLLL